VSLSNLRHSVPRRVRQALEAALKPAAGNLNKQLELLIAPVAIPSLAGEYPRYRIEVGLSFVSAQVR
jgi:hypothetical protein